MIHVCCLVYKLIKTKAVSSEVVVKSLPSNTFFVQILVFKTKLKSSILENCALLLIQNSLQLKITVKKKTTDKTISNVKMALQMDVYKMNLLNYFYSLNPSILKTLRRLE